MKKTKTLLLSLLVSSLAACGVDSVPTDPEPGPILIPIDPPAPDDTKTWRDVTEEWAVAWCAFSERCLPIEHEGWGGECLAEVAEMNCSYLGDACDAAWPGSDADLELCLATVETMRCAHAAPAACLRAFGGG